MSIMLDELDNIASQAFEGFIVRKDLVRKYKGQYPVPTYVVEFLLGRYCSTTDETEISEGLQIVERQLRERSVRAGEEELFKSRAERSGKIRIIDVINARLDTKTNSYVAELPSLRIRDARISAELVEKHDRMLTGGFYAEIELVYDPTIAEEQKGRPFGVETIREIQISKRDVLETLARGRASFTFDQWRDFLLRSIGLEPSALSPRTRDIMLLRMVPFVESNYNAVELGPRGTPELQSEDSIGEDPLPPGQVWVMSPGGMDENPGLFRIECNGGPGSGVRILNQTPPGPLKESVKCAEQNLYARGKELVGDRDPRSHE